MYLFLRDNYKSLYSIAAICLVAAGSGFVNLFPYAADYESKAFIAAYKLEQATGLVYSKGIDCNHHPEEHANCMYVKYLEKHSKFINKLLISKILTLLTIVFFFSALSGLYFHYHNYKESKQSS